MATEDVDFANIKRFTSLRILGKWMKIAIPTQNVRQVGWCEVIRKDRWLAFSRSCTPRDLERRHHNVTVGTEYMEKIKTGSIFEGASWVLQGLYS